MRGHRRVLARDHRLPRLLLLLLVLLLLLWRGDDVVVLHHDPHAGALARPGPLQPGHDVFVEADDEAARPDEDEEGQEDGHQEGVPTVPVLGHWPRPATWPHTGRGHDARSVGLQCPNPGSAHDAVCTVLSSRQRPDHGYCYESFIAMCEQRKNKLSTAVALCLQI